MGNFDLADYEPVEARIRRFYADHPDGRIHTDLLSSPNDIAVPVVKAYLWVGEALVATGMAFEKAGDGFVNKTSHLENCETSAIGRALANFNYSGDKRPSREEMQKVERGEKPDSKAVALYAECVDLINENIPSEEVETFEKAMKWLNDHLKTVGGMTAAKKKLQERFNSQVEEAFNRADAELKEVGI